jgi:tetratricopeptide (TPR) repeat protein
MATLANIRSGFEDWLTRVAKQDDRVLIYFAGNGFIHAGKAYLAPYDFDPAQPAQTGYEMKALSDLVANRIQSKSKILLTDACHSGAITPDTDIQTLNRTLANLDQSIFSLTASGERESSLENAALDGGHGVFTYFVVKGLTGEADESCDGVVTADELAEYVRANVRKYTSNRQNPTFPTRGSFDSHMLLAYNPSHVCAQPAPFQFGTFVIESNLDGVEVFVDSESAGVVNAKTPLVLPGLKPGKHSVKGVKLGYEPDGPREELLSPGERHVITLKILIRAHRKQAAVRQFEQGFRLYEHGYADHYRQAVVHFQKALNEDPSYSQAAMFLGRAYSALFDFEQAKKGFQVAINIDPDYFEARSSYAGLLLDRGELDEAVRQLTVVLHREPENQMANSMMAQGLQRKELFADAAKYARVAIVQQPSDAEPHFWLADALRRAAQPSATQLQESQSEYLTYLKLSNFDSGLAGKLHYYVLGYLIGMGKKKHAAQEDIWKDLRSLAYAGLGDCDRLLGNSETAISYYQRALFFDPLDPLVHFSLAVAFTQKSEGAQSKEPLLAARDHFQTMLRLNPDLEESNRAKVYLSKIDSVLQRALRSR